MATKIVTTKSGKTIKVELVREVQDKVAYADGQKIVTGREIVEYTNINFYDGKKLIASGKEIGPLVGSNAKQMAAQGAAARIGVAAISQDVVNQIKAAFAELEAENPKSAEYLAIEQAKADARARWDAEEPKRRRDEMFARRMDDPNSDL